MNIGSDYWRNTIVDGASQLGVPIDASALDQFACHAAELLKWAGKTSLTTLTDPLEMATGHYTDSVAVTPHIKPNDVLLDIGSGGGFPGIPIKVLCPAVTALLIDGSRKKVSFLLHILRILDLKGIDARQVRAEDMANEASSTGRYSVVVCRALTDLVTFVGYARPLLAANGRAIAMRGKVSEKEIANVKSYIARRAPACKGDPARVGVKLIPYRLPNLRSCRFLVVIQVSRWQ